MVRKHAGNPKHQGDVILERLLATRNALGQGPSTCHLSICDCPKPHGDCSSLNLPGNFQQPELTRSHDASGTWYSNNGDNNEQDVCSARGLHVYGEPQHVSSDL